MKPGSSVVFEKGVNFGAAKASEELKILELNKDFEDVGIAKDQKMQYQELCDHIAKRVREISMKQDYELGIEEKKAIEKLFNSIDKSNSKAIGVQDFTTGIIEYIFFCKGKQTDLQKKIEEVKNEISGLETQKAKDQTNKEFFQKTVKLWVMEARDLPPMDVTGLSDPYAIVHFANQDLQTRTIPNNLNPVWNEVFQL